MHNKKRLAVNISATLLFILFLVIIGASFYLVDFSLVNNEGKNMDNAAKRLETRYPDVKVWCDSMINVKALRDTFIIDEDGNRLHALYAYASQKTDNTALIIHGYGNNSISYMYLGYMFNKSLDFNIIMPDLYAHGLSDGDDIQMGLKDADDVMLWADVAYNVFGKNTRIVVHGTSMGAATAMIVSGKENKPFIKCYIEDSGYTSAWDEFEFQLDEMYGLPAFPLLYTSSLITKIKYGWFFDDACPERYVESCKKPMLFIHSDNDTFVPSWMVNPLYKAKPAPKEIWIVHESPHAMAYHDYPCEYTQHIKDFVYKYGLK